MIVTAVNTPSTQSNHIDDRVADVSTNSARRFVAKCSRPQTCRLPGGRRVNRSTSDCLDVLTGACVACVPASPPPRLIDCMRTRMSVKSVDHTRRLIITQQPQQSTPAPHRAYASPFPFTQPLSRPSIFRPSSVSCEPSPQAVFQPEKTYDATEMTYAAGKVLTSTTTTLCLSSDDVIYTDARTHTARHLSSPNYHKAYTTPQQLQPDYFSDLYFSSQAYS